MPAITKVVTDASIEPLFPQAPIVPNPSVEQARGQLEAACAGIEAALAGKMAWAVGEAFTLADCAAAPALYFANALKALPPRSAGYLERLKSRPSVARTLEEAAPYLAHWPPRGEH